jgi:ubiquinone/menaquinone biosynthesis C-methylase UbiE
MSLRRLARNWNALAEDDPMWSILTWEDKRGNRWGAEEFFATGRDEIGDVLRRAREHQPDLGRGRALDFGCGVGRLSLALVPEFDEVHGVDVAENMIEAARRFDHEGAVRYVANETADLALFPDEHFDFIYSSITLQHMSPELMRGYLAEFARVLRSGGVLVFQLPETPRRSPNPNVMIHKIGVIGSKLLRRVRTMFSRAPTMDMFGMSPIEVSQILQRHGCAAPRVEPSTLAGVDWVSWLYLATKDAP